MYKRNKELYDYLMENYVTGKVSKKEVCEKFKLNKDTLGSFMYYHKIRKNKNYGEIEELLKKGESPKKIAEKLNTSKSTIYKRMKELGFKKSYICS